jgi:uncharacterized lipoprotein YddW (UPF0748 family)
MNLKKIELLLFLVVMVVMGCKDTKQNSKPEFWVWMHADANKSAADWEADFDKLQRAGFDGVLIGARPQVLKVAVPEAKKFGLEVHAWFWTMNRGDADTAWLSVNQHGQSLAQHSAYVNYYKFMCPALPAVKNFLKAKIDTLALINGLDGIHLDYVRYVDAILPIGLQPKYGLEQDSIFPEFDYGYHPFMLDLYSKKTGIHPPDLHNPAYHHDWVQFRLDELNKTVWDLRDHIRGLGLEATAAVFPTPDMAAKMVRQEWDQWYLDSYFPMVYHNFYNEDINWIKSVISENKASVPGDAKIYCGLYLPAMQAGSDLAAAIRSAVEGGADGIALFDYNALNNDLRKTVESFTNMNRSGNSNP